MHARPVHSQMQTVRSARTVSTRARIGLPATTPDHAIVGPQNPLGKAASGGDVV
jgi:hypothetical protein